MNELIEEIYSSDSVEDASGRKYPLHSYVGRPKGEFLFNFIRSREHIIRTLEVGCAYGLSSLHITNALRGRPSAHHVIIDPFQNTVWRGVGINYLRRSEIDFFELREEPSEIVLPKLVEAHPESFDLIFIDGWHTFDHTLIDLFFANRLLRVGGYLIVDDCHLPGVAKAMSYVAKYPCYERISELPRRNKPRLIDRMIAAIPETLAAWTIPRRVYDFHYAPMQFSMAALQKTRPDERDYMWFESF